MPMTHSFTAAANQKILHHYVATSASVLTIWQWVRSNRLQLNAGKTELMWFVPPRRRHQMPADQLTVQSASIAPVESVRDLGVYLDSDMSMHTHVTRLV